jgi:hypothetical protein
MDDWRRRPWSVDPRIREIRLAVEKAVEAGATWVEITGIIEGCRHLVEHRNSLLESRSP